MYHCNSTSHTFIKLFGSKQCSRCVCVCMSIRWIRGAKTGCSVCCFVVWFYAACDAYSREFIERQKEMNIDSNFVNCSHARHVYSFECEFGVSLSFTFSTQNPIPVYCMAKITESLYQKKENIKLTRINIQILAVNNIRLRTNVNV